MVRRVLSLTALMLAGVFAAAHAQSLFSGPETRTKREKYGSIIRPLNARRLRATEQEVV